MEKGKWAEEKEKWDKENEKWEKKWARAKKFDLHGWDKIVISFVFALASFASLLIPLLSEMEGQSAAVGFLVMPFIAMVGLIFARKAKAHGWDEDRRNVVRIVARTLSAIGVGVGLMMFFPAIAVIIGTNL